MDKRHKPHSRAFNSISVSLSSYWHIDLRQQVAGSSHFCCDLEVSLTFQLLLSLHSLSATLCRVQSRGWPKWGEIKWGVQSFFFCCSFYSWPDNQSTGAQGLCSALCHCPSLPISMVSTQTQCWLTDHNVFSCVYVTSVPLCCWQILPFQIGGEIMVYNPRSNTQWPAVSQRYTHTTDSIRLWWWSEENWPNYYY